MTDGLDYLGGVRILSFVPNGPTTQCVDYTILGDDIFEGIEVFAVTLTTLSATPLTISPSSATVVIVGDDGQFPLINCILSYMVVSMIATLE